MNGSQTEDANRWHFTLDVRSHDQQQPSAVVQHKLQGRNQSVTPGGCLIAVGETAKSSPAKQG